MKQVHLSSLIDLHNKNQKVGVLGAGETQSCLENSLRNGLLDRTLLTTDPCADKVSQNT
jgi:hypothetical protein